MNFKYKYTTRLIIERQKTVQHVKIIKIYFCGYTSVYSCASNDIKSLRDNKFGDVNRMKSVLNVRKIVYRGLEGANIKNRLQKEYFLLLKTLIHDYMIFNFI